ncbi:MAG: efflux RND transporter periplasmic adaptor subunit [Kiritimatiellia bacterium]|jgi:RND family efflux transporter MFP subunit|nr:efflux RND transporter periplasmic adaptor subunit [Kiritimatiellia bacterium]
MKVGNKNVMGKVIGSVLLVAGVAAIFLYKVTPQELPADTTIRPIKSVVVAEGQVWPTLYFPGTIEADTEVDLSFEVAGRLVEFSVNRGMKVKKGDVLGRIDPSNFENQVKNAEADLEQARSSLERIERALKVNAVSQEEASQARAAVQKTEALLAIQRKALSDTVLTATFDGRVSETYADAFDTVTPGRAVLKLQDVERLALAVSVPEGYIMSASPEQLSQATYTIQFDPLPGTHVPAKLKEFATMADPVTQTYRARFTFENPDGVRLLPGMTGTVEVEVAHPQTAAAVLQVPSNAVGFDSAGEAFVWVLQSEDDGVYAAQRRTIRLGERNGDELAVTDGLTAGERIATAGVAILTEGRRVRLLEDSTAITAVKTAAPKSDAVPEMSP